MSPLLLKILSFLAGYGLGVLNYRMFVRSIEAIVDRDEKRGIRKQVVMAGIFRHLFVFLAGCNQQMTDESVEEGLDDLAYKWGDKSDDFKHALMLIRSSLIESDAERRSELLEKASSDVLEGSKEKMDLYARELSQPTVYLYYFGILLPLLLAIILPIGSSFTGLSIAKPEYLFSMIILLAIINTQSP